MSISRTYFSNLSKILLRYNTVWWGQSDNDQQWISLEKTLQCLFWLSNKHWNDYYLHSSSRFIFARRFPTLYHLLLLSYYFQISLNVDNQFTMSSCFYKFRNRQYKNKKRTQNYCYYSRYEKFKFYTFAIAEFVIYCSCFVKNKANSDEGLY